ncbi:hypothetical protein NPIL_351471 [Nephila pilipes]|uniref:Uncharacterized protein n=1 Tax=Nephila pilipes TaxID=299642 RepID=A0A8X6PKD1_NEPPI|nr:hypothetical protein NPIL_351471 [Nephila pilipes]
MVIMLTIIAQLGEKKTEGWRSGIYRSRAMLLLCWMMVGKTLEKWHLGGIAAQPHTEKVNWDDDDLSDDDDEQENCDSCGKPFSSEDDSVQDEKKKQQHSEPSKGQCKYIFPVCNKCDFGWRFDSKKKLFCPQHRRVTTDK